MPARDQNPNSLKFKQEQTRRFFELFLHAVHLWSEQVRGFLENLLTKAEQANELAAKENEAAAEFQEMPIPLLYPPLEAEKAEESSLIASFAQAVAAVCQQMFQDAFDALNLAIANGEVSEEHREPMEKALRETFHPATWFSGVVDCYRDIQSNPSSQPSLEEVHETFHEKLTTLHRRASTAMSESSSDALAHSACFSTFHTFARQATGIVSQNRADTNSTLDADNFLKEANNFGSSRLLNIVESLFFGGLRAGLSDSEWNNNRLFADPDAENAASPDQLFNSASTLNF